MGWVKARKGPTGTRFTGVYLDPAGRERSAGTFPTAKEARLAAQRAESTVDSGEWIDRKDGRVTFRDYAERWYAGLMVEISTRVGYRSYLDAHFLPAFGELPMNRIHATTVQAWVKGEVDRGALSARSVVKYHAMLNSLFRRAVVDRVIPYNPCTNTKLPKVPRARVRARQRRVLTPEDFDRLLTAIPQRHRLLLLTDIETGLRWGELVALRRRHVDFLHQVIHVEQVIVETSLEFSPTGERYVVKDYPKDDEPRSLRITAELTTAIEAHADTAGLGPDDLLFTFASRPGVPMSRHTWRKRYWQPGLKAADLPGLRMHDLRHAHASWLLAGGADLETVRERMGHASITTTQLYLHTLPDDSDSALAAFRAVRSRRAKAHE